MLDATGFELGVENGQLEWGLENGRLELGVENGRFGSSELVEAGETADALVEMEEREEEMAHFSAREQPSSCVGVGVWE